MSKWIAEFDLEDGDTMPEHMDLEYKGTKIDFYCKPVEQESILDKIRAEIKYHSEHFINDDGDDCLAVYEDDVFEIIDKYKAESEVEE